MDNNNNDSKERWASLRLPVGYAEQQHAVKQAVVAVNVGKPSKHQFVRTSKDESQHFEAGLLKDDDGTLYLVIPGMFPILGDLVKPYRLVTTYIKHAGIMLWALRYPNTNRTTDLWATSAMEAADIAQNKWVRIQGNMSLGYYEVSVAQGDLGEPDWPSVTIEELLDKAFAGRIVDSEDHPIVRRLRGLE